MDYPSQPMGTRVGNQNLFRQNVQRVARERLAAGPAYRIYFNRISVHFRDGILTLRGRLPSFYLKQVLQTQLRGIEGVAHIHNQVDVVDSS